MVWQFLDGKLAAVGPYDELLEKSESFAKFIEECKTENDREKEAEKESDDSGLHAEGSSQMDGEFLSSWNGNWFFHDFHNKYQDCFRNRFISELPEFFHSFYRIGFQVNKKPCTLHSNPLLPF